MTYLVDANVLCEPTKPDPDPTVVEWLRTHAAECVVDPVILGEMRFGILLLPHGKKRTALEQWFTAGIAGIRCLEWDSTHGLQWADLLARLRRKGVALPIKDSLIATTALTHGLIVATRNQADFAKAGVRVVNPFLGRR